MLHPGFESAIPVRVERPNKSTLRNNCFKKKINIIKRMSWHNMAGGQSMKGARVVNSVPSEPLRSYSTSLSKTYQIPFAY